jgi:hypothetical protein
MDALAVFRDRRLATWAEARDLAFRTAAENRAFTPAEQFRWEVLQAELNALDARITAVRQALASGGGERRPIFVVRALSREELAQ